MAIGGALLYSFYKSTTQCDRYTSVEGLQQMESRNAQWGIIIITFLLLVFYLPLSTMSVHVLVWSQELWAIPNPYINATTFPPVVPPLGPSNEYRDPLDFCWTTTMKRNEVNYAPVVVVLSGIVFFFVSNFIHSLTYPFDHSLVCSVVSYQTSWGNQTICAKGGQIHRARPPSQQSGYGWRVPAFTQPRS